jgi:hypothetical protein
MKTPRHTERGSALLVAVMLMGVILVLTLGLLTFASSEQNRAVNNARAIPRNYCTEAGLQLARTYFGNNYPSWDSFLGDPNHYNPVNEPWMGVATGSAGGLPNGRPFSIAPQAPPYTGSGVAAGILPPCAAGFVQVGNICIPTWWSSCAGPIATCYANLFVDLDGDGYPDVYLYIRNNADYLPTSTAAAPPSAIQLADGYLQDNDNKVFVGAICISQTLGPRLPDGQLDPSSLTVEAPLNYTPPESNSQGGGSTGAHNLN